MGGTSRLGADFVAHDDDWQTPAITELHAFRAAKDQLPAAPGFLYLAFPWATLIDQIVHKQDASPLKASLDELALRTRGATRVVTVCQHIFMRDFVGLFAEAGVTDIFWAHQRNDEAPFGDIKVAPFPLYPANSPGPRPSSAGEPRFLFSFVGTRPNPLYLDNVRRLIVDELAGSPGGCVVERPDWHFFRDVYDKQIYKRAGTFEDPLANPAAVEYRAVMADSLFALCPSGTGPNSLRLWEAIDAGVIPVVLSERYLPPGDPRLWSEAVITADIGVETIRSLPRRLARIAGDTARIEAMRSALTEVRARYGVDGFVHDIIRLYEDANGRPQPPAASAGSARRAAVSRKQRLPRS